MNKTTHLSDAATPLPPRPRLAALTVARLLFLFYYMAGGAYFPFINLFYARIGLSGVQIGTLAALPVFINITFSPLLGGIADARRWHRRILSLAFLLSAIAVFLQSRMSTMLFLAPVVIAYAIFHSPIITLLDSYGMETATQHQRSYGELRLWGSLGWAVATVITGWLMERLDIRWLFYSFTIYIGVAFIISLFQQPRQKVLQISFRSGLKDLLAKKAFLLFLCSIFLLSVATSGVLTILSIYLDAIGTPGGLMGAGLALSALAEVPMLLLSGRLMRRIGPKGMLALGFILFALRILLFSFVKTPVWALAVQLINAPAYTFFLTGSINYIYQLTSEGLYTTALAIFNAVVYGVGSMVGAMLSGILLDEVSMGVQFLILGAIAVVSLGVLLTGQRFGAKPAPVT